MLRDEKRSCRAGPYFTVVSKMAVIIWLILEVIAILIDSNFRVSYGETMF
jgi:hypothetical protein